MSAESLSETLARHWESVRFHEIPEAVRRAAALHILDTVGTILAGSRMNAGRQAYDLAISLNGRAEVTLPGTGDRVPLLEGVLAAATAAHCGEMDDIHGGAGTCVGGMVVPALLAIAEKYGADSHTFLEATVVGYETTVRVGLAINAPQLFSRGWWPSAVCGVFGVAAAGAKLLGWPAERMATALGIAGLHTGGLLTGGPEGPTARHLTFGRSAQSGVLALLASMHGFTGPKKIFEDPRGFCLTLCEQPRWEYLQAHLDKYFLPETAFKPFPCARQLHAGVGALLELLHKEGITADAIEEIELGVPATPAAMVDRPQVHGNRAASLASAQYVLAVTALRGELNLNSFEPEFLESAEVLRLMEKIRVKVDEELEPYFPKQWPGKVRVKLAGGKSLVSQVLSPKGEIENPMSTAELEEKFQTLAVPVLGTEKASMLAQGILGLENSRSLEGIFTALASRST